MIGNIDFKNMDKKTRIQVFAVSVMVILFIIIMANSLKTILKSKNPRQTPYITPAAFQELVRRNAPVSVNQPSAISDNVPWGRDPFSEKSSSVGGEWAVSDLKLEGILCQKGAEPHALINGEVVLKGDKIGNLTVVLIEEDAVILTDGEKNYKLNLW